MDDLDFSRYIKIILKWAWLILLTAAIAGGISYKVSESLPRVYRASVSLMVGDLAVNPNVTPDEVGVSQRLATTYSQMAQRQPVLNATIDALHLPVDWIGLRTRVLVTHTDGNQFIDIRVLDSDPERAKVIADEIVNQLILQSPTASSLKQLDASHAFGQKQMESLQNDIQQAEDSLAQKKADLQKADNARSVLDTQDEIKALELKLTSWRATYSTLLTAYQSRPANTLSVIEPASTESEPVSPNVRANVALAAVLGMLIAIGALFLIESTNDTIETTGQLARTVSHPVLGSLEKIGRIKEPSLGLITHLEPYAPVSEAFRLLRTHVTTQTAGDGPVPILVTSPGSGEGKSFVSANLAVCYAQSGKSVILVDADIRSPMVNSYLDVPNNEGLASIFTPHPDVAGLEVEPETSSGDLALLVKQLCIATVVPGLRVLPSGPMTVNPGELFGTPKMQQLLHVLQTEADVVIIDSPPVLAVADTAILAKNWVAVILLVRAGKTQQKLIRQASETLIQTHARTIGTILNGVSSSNLTYGPSRYYNAPRSGGQSKASFPLRLVQGRGRGTSGR